MIKNILFDMGGVIFIQDTSEAVRRFAEAGIDTDKYMGIYGQKDFFLDLEAGKIDKATFCRRMKTATGNEHISEDEASFCWLGYIKEVPLERLRALQNLRKKYKLGLASNTNPFVMDYMDSPQISSDHRPISDYFDYLFTSYTMGVCKPSPEYFIKALDSAGIKAHETLFVDDSEANIKAAQNVGLHGLHIEHNADWRPIIEKLLG